MPVPTAITDLSSTASSNSPAGTDSPVDGDNFIRALSKFIRDLYDGALTLSNKTIASPIITGTATFSGAATGITDLTTTGNTVLGNASTDTLDVGNGGLVKDASGNVGVGVAPTQKLDVNGAAIRFTNGTYTTYFGGTSLAASSAANDSTIRWDGASGSLVFSYQGTAPKLTISSAGLLSDVNGNELGYKGLPQNVQGGGYTLVASDHGKCVIFNAGNATIPASVFAAGDAVTIYSNSGGAMSVIQGAGLTLRFGGSTAAGGNRALGANGVCTVYFINSTVATISGSQLT